MATQETPIKTPRRSKRWIWFFAILGTMLVAGISTEIWFNVNQQLQPEQLAEARQRWPEKGPRDYRLIYEVKDEVNPELASPVPLKFAIDVRNGKVTAVYKPIGTFSTFGSTGQTDLQVLAAETVTSLTTPNLASGMTQLLAVKRFQDAYARFGSMDELFDFVERTLQDDIAQGGKRPFIVVRFQKSDGHIVHYVRSVSSRHERLEIRVELKPLE